ncbi:Hsp70 family protein [Nocardia wallacei]|uniref:Hsp70 family protein n=1 Tax=Nocardia wallacei TaxID=480035 RepID=UPI002457D261|nr:Hsp70 family protein [Nocardia wallacei]
MNSVRAAAGERDRPAVRVRRTAVTFDSAGGARMGGLPRFAPVVTDFADLTQHTEPVIVGGRAWTPPELVAAVAACLIDTDEPASGPVVTYPACYTDRQLVPLRLALDRAGVGDALLMPEPVAAVEWLDAEHGVSESGLTLVYDLGGSSLDLAIVRTEGDRDDRGVLGSAVRSHRYGGRPLGTVLARYARALGPGAPAPVSKVVPAGDTARLRTWTVRNSLRLVRKCVHHAGLTMRDIDRVLLVGGAARPQEVAQVLAELGRPVVISQDPAHTVAIGAAIAAARMADPGSNLGRYARGAAVLSSAAVASAVAMSAATMFGSGPIGTDGPALEFAPALAGPANGARNQFRDLRVFEGLDSVPGLAAGADGLLSSFTPARAYSAVAQSFSDVAAATANVERAVREYGPGEHCDPISRQVSGYADPARFTNPMPFGSTARMTGNATPAGTSTGKIPSISLPRIGSAALPSRAMPGPISLGGLSPSDSRPAAGSSLANPRPDAGTRSGTGRAGGNATGASTSDDRKTAPVAGTLPGPGTGGGWTGGGLPSAGSATDPARGEGTGPGGSGSGPTPSGGLSSGARGPGSSPPGSGGSSAGSGDSPNSGGLAGGGMNSGGMPGGGANSSGVSGGGGDTGGMSGGGGGSGGVSGGGGGSGGVSGGGGSGGMSGGGGHSGGVAGGSVSGGGANTGGGFGGSGNKDSASGGSKSGGSKSGGSGGGGSGGGGGGGSRR